jgi:hypothetical protein
MTEDLAAQAQPTEVQLESFFRENQDKYSLPERRAFTHIFFDVDKRGDGGVDAARQLLAELRLSSDSVVHPTDLGDRFMLEHEYPPESQIVVSRLFGERFAEALFDVKPGEWHGPIASGYGLHLVRVNDVWPAEQVGLDAVRDDVLRDYSDAIRRQANETTYSTLASEYEIRIDEEAIRAIPLSGDPVGENR